MKTVLAWFAENHVAANLLMAFLILAGVVTAMNIKVEIFPETTLDTITITTPYPGASPSEVEEGVVRRIEEAVAGIAGIRRIDSVAREGVSRVTVEVMTGWDRKALLDEIKSAVDRIRAMPEEAEDSVVTEVTRRNLVLHVTLYGDTSELTLKRLAQRIKDDITDLPGVTLVELSGIRENEIHVDVSENTLRKYNLTLEGVARAIREASLDLPAGSIKTPEGEVLVRTKGRLYDADDYRDIAVINRPDGTRVTLGRIADVSEGFEDTDVAVRFNGKPAAQIDVYRVADQNALEVADTVHEYVQKLRPTLPEGLDVAFSRDRSTILRSRLDLLSRNMAMGLVIVVVLLGLFLNVRLAFWVTLGIPISFAAGLACLPWFDVSINMISLFAFIMVLGIVVDDAIVIGENIFRTSEEGALPMTAAVEGSYEVGRPVIFSVLTTMAAFSPLLLAGGVMGNFMRNLPVVVILVLAGSLVESLLILPAHLGKSRALARHRKPVRVGFMARGLKWVVNKPYAAAVDFCVRWRYATLGLGIALLMAAMGAYAGGYVKFDFFPRLEGDSIRAYITMPTGTPRERTGQVLTEMEQSLMEVIADLDAQRPEGSPSLFEHSQTLLGMHTGRRGAPTDTGGHLGMIMVELLEGEQRGKIMPTDIIRQWRKSADNIPDIQSLSFRSTIHSAGEPVEIHLSMDDDETLLTAVDRLKAELAGYDGVFDIEDSFLEGKKELQLSLGPAARSLGLNLDDLARQVRHAFHGAEALRFQRGNDEITVVVRYPETERTSLGAIERMRIRTPEGDRVPFSEVAEVRVDRGYESIERAQRRRVVKVVADVDESKATAEEIRTVLMSEVMPAMASDYPGLRYTMEGEGKERMESLADVKKGFLIALFVIYALLAIPFRSFAQPFVVMAAIPFGVAGAVAGHLIMGMNMSILSLFGMVGLAGVVVNDSLILVDKANRIRQDGEASRPAVCTAGGIRFRAILLTSLTTFGGLLPMLMETSRQARFLIPMAVSLGFGVLFATVITLVLIPCLYMVLEDIMGGWRAFGRLMRGE
ncbi:MAG: efflux RND transporter permease subunit [Desulfatibacillaceae bacterium]